jgi:hypothetical protein
MSGPRFQRGNFVVGASRAAGLKVFEEEHLVTQDGREGRAAGITI